MPAPIGVGIFLIFPPQGYETLEGGALCIYLFLITLVRCLIKF